MESPWIGRSPAMLALFSLAPAISSSPGNSWRRDIKITTCSLVELRGQCERGRRVPRSVVLRLDPGIPRGGSPLHHALQQPCRVGLSVEGVGRGTPSGELHEVVPGSGS